MLRQVGPWSSPPNASLWRTRPCPIRPCPPPRLPFTPFTVSLSLCIPLNTGLLLGPLRGPFTPGPLHMQFLLPEAPPPYSHPTFNSPLGSTQVSHPQGSLSNSQVKSAPLPPPLSQHMGECVYRAHSPHDCLETRDHGGLVGCCATSARHTIRVQNMSDGGWRTEGQTE